MTYMSKFILKLFGWKATGYEKLWHIPKFVIAIAPHTSNWDFLVGILVRSAYKLQKIKYLGKESLFKFPHGVIFRALGGYPVTRSGHKNQVDSYIDAFKANQEFAIVIAPEGTRKKVNRLKTGYYFIARGAYVPVIPTIMNYKTRTVEFGDPFIPGQDEAKDLAYLDKLFQTNVGKYPELSFQG